jgi:hypothetical protein
MSSSFDLVYRCYIVPAVGAALYIVFTLPLVNEIFLSWIPDPFYANLIKALIIFSLLFITCRILDILNLDECHPNCEGCATPCIGTAKNTFNNPENIQDNIVTEKDLLKNADQEDYIITITKKEKK